jgi:hypothetical protein
MPGKGHAKFDKGGGRGAPTIERGPDELRRGQAADRAEQSEHGRPESGDLGRPDLPGRSEQSPGHLKKAAGARSARDFAPGRRKDMDQVDRSVVPGDTPEDLPLT